MLCVPRNVGSAERSRDELELVTVTVSPLADVGTDNETLTGASRFWPTWFAVPTNIEIDPLLTVPATAWKLLGVLNVTEGKPNATVVAPFVRAWKAVGWEVSPGLN